MTQEKTFSGRRLRQARYAHGWSQARLAREAGIRERQIIRMENEQHTPRADMVAAVANATGRPLDFFFEDGASRERAEAADDEEDDLMGALTSTIDRLIEKRVTDLLRRERSAA